jgi:hypothetical protein
VGVASLLAHSFCHCRRRLHDGVCHPMSPLSPRPLSPCRLEEIKLTLACITTSTPQTPLDPVRLLARRAASELPSGHPECTSWSRVQPDSIFGPRIHYRLNSLKSRSCASQSTAGVCRWSYRHLEALNIHPDLAHIRGLDHPGSP